MDRADWAIDRLSRLSIIDEVQAGAKLSSISGLAIACNSFIANRKTIYESSSRLIAWNKLRYIVGAPIADECRLTCDPNI